MEAMAETAMVDVLEGVLKNLNTWIVVFATAVAVWAIRQVVPDEMENSGGWKILLRLIPLAIGIGIALIPGLRPMPENMAQSGAIGFIGGTFSQSAYDLLKTVAKVFFGQKAQALLASKAARNSLNGG